MPEKNQGMEEHVDALYKVAHTAPPAAATQALMLLFHLAVGSQLEAHNNRFLKKSKSAEDVENSRKDRFYRALFSSLLQKSLLDSGKHMTMYFNLLYKAMKYDTDETRVCGFAKRILAVTIHGSPSVVSASLFLLNEIAKTHHDVRKCMEEPADEQAAKLIVDSTKREPRAAFVIYDQAGQEVKGENDNSIPIIPTFWELALLAHHFHPSVSKFATDAGRISYAGDPLKDFGLAPFLDKFAYRNPKSTERLANHFKRGESIAERKSGRDKLIEAQLAAPVNDPEFLKQERVSEQEEFFLKYFRERARRDEIKGIVRNKPKLEDDEEIEMAEEGALGASEETQGLEIGKKSVSMSVFAVNIRHPTFHRLNNCSSIIV